MKNLTQEELVMDYLANECNGDWTFGYMLIGRQTQRGWLGSSIERSCRKLAEKGYLEKRRNKKFTEFRIKVNLN